MQTQNNVQLCYNKVYCDDLGKKAPDLFSKNIPEFISYRKMWAGTVDGFMQCSNSDLIFFCTEGSIRLVVVTDTIDSHNKFSQFFLTESVLSYHRWISVQQNLIFYPEPYQPRFHQMH